MVAPDIAGNHFSFESDGFQITLRYPDPAALAESDAAMYLLVGFGVMPPGRTLQAFRLMLEANLSVYAQDQAQLGLEPASGEVVLIARVALDADIDGGWLADLVNHYVQHGRYWRDTILACTDEMYAALCTGEYLWIRV
ncbi:4-hydroxyphenylacetate 3-monooxygenase [Xanthomonas hyacinthi]|uniref:4-hydroxyphenylacetate 3-monooxygenase n=2 Tax=Xanthomonas hyacinthi TaxID=56455 RepID=A0A2S7ERG7_9XANT|nr:4-hydroxyphenylacetate 3-monooxygenase [Xanthomonas hyacinthi]QGY78062.1 4-hydroxyphenylacetate 3-monooxygenase [Xanthomonas hyacinthi]